ncbi:hypothetical protein M432DRAFT_379225 [Thermoascus aurantiacus ATCC 26904]
MMNAATAPARLSARLISRRWATSQYGAAFLPTVRQGRPQSTSSNLPKIVQPSIWTSIIPKFMRNRGPRDPRKESPKSKEWNPATFFIMIFLLIGSQAIQILILKNDWATYSRRADAKVQLLKEVIERIKNGEKVDVEKLLGTGDEAKEREWEEVLREIEEEDSLWHQKAIANYKDDESRHSKDDSSAKATASAVPQGNSKNDTPKESASARMSRFY